MCQLSGFFFFLLICMQKNAVDLLNSSRVEKRLYWGEGHLYIAFASGAKLVQSAMASE